MASLLEDPSATLYVYMYEYTDFYAFIVLNNFKKMKEEC